MFRNSMKREFGALSPNAYASRLKVESISSTTASNPNPASLRMSQNGWKDSNRGRTGGCIENLR